MRCDSPIFAEHAAAIRRLSRPRVRDAYAYTADATMINRYRFFIRYARCARMRRRAMRAEARTPKTTRHILSSPTATPQEDAACRASGRLRGEAAQRAE